jgi:sortase A
MVLAAGLVAGCGMQPTTEVPLAVAQPAVAVPQSTTTTTTTAPPPPAPALASVPAAPRAARAPASVPVVGRLIVPRLGLDTTLYQGESLRIIDHGPSHMPWTALPGQIGNVTVAGHRVTNTRPFRHLDTMQLGDTATFVVPSGSYTYEFVGHEIVTPDRVDITSQGAEYTATLFACHPPGSARYRIVAYFRMTSAPEPGQPILGR